jgi:hypothetical protein
MGVTRHEINWGEILPLNAIAKSQDEKIQRFHAQQVKQGYKTSTGIHL